MDVNKFRNLVNDKEINIITHNDPDGIVASAVFIRALKDMGYKIDKKNIFFEGPSNIQNKKSKFLDENSEFSLSGIIVILDLPYHEKADIWLDHHESNKAIKNISDKILINSQEKSASYLTYDFFVNNLGLNKNIFDLKFLNYVDARDRGIKPKENKVEYEDISLSIYENRNSYSFFKNLVMELVDNDNILEISNNRHVKKREKKKRKKIERGILELKNMVIAKEKEDFIANIDNESEKPLNDKTKRFIFYYNGFVFLDLSDIINYEIENKYGITLPYFILEKELNKKNLDFSFFLVYAGDDKTGNIHCSISINQKKDRLSKEIDVSKFAHKYGGGGHKFVAGFTILPNKYLEVIYDILESFNSYL